MWVHRGASLNQLVVVRVPAPSSAFWHTLVGMLGHLSTASQRCQAPYLAGLSWHEWGKVTLLCSSAEIEWLLTQSCVSCYFVHFLVLWLEKASFPPPPTTHQFASSRLPASSVSSLGNIWPKENPDNSWPCHYPGSGVFICPAFFSPHFGVLYLFYIPCPCF